MDESKTASSPINLQTLLLVVAVAGGVYLAPSALRSSRPGEKESLERTSLGDQVVPAWLWEDSLEAAKNYREKLRASSPEASRANIKLSTNELHSIGELAQQISREYDQLPERDKTPPTLLVLQVMISGGSYAEDAETRHRARYAVLSALGVAGNVPFDSERIGYCEVDWPRGAARLSDRRRGEPGGSGRQPRRRNRPERRMALFSVTSAAALQLAGAVALLLGAKPGLTPAQGREALCKTAIDVTVGHSFPERFNSPVTLGPDAATGFGMVNAAAAVAYAQTNF